MDGFKTYLAVFDANDVQIACTGLSTDVDPTIMSRYVKDERVARVEVRDEQDRSRLHGIGPAGREV